MKILYPSNHFKYEVINKEKLPKFHKGQIKYIGKAKSLHRPVIYMIL